MIFKSPGGDTQGHCDNLGNLRIFWQEKKDISKTYSKFFKKRYFDGISEFQAFIYCLLLKNDNSTLVKSNLSWNC